MKQRTTIFDERCISYPFGVLGTTIRVIEAGEGPDPLILLHGIGARADRWRLNMATLADEGFRVFALDFPGHGFSEKSGAFAHSVPEYARLVRRFAQEVAPGAPAVLVGTSMGGHVAASAALADPSGTRALVLVGPVGLRPLGEPARRRIAESIVDTTPEGIRRKLAGILHDERLATPEWIAEEHRVNTSPGAAEALAAVARYFRDRVDEDVLGDDDLRTLVGAVPTMLVWGAADEAVPVSIADDLERTLGLEVARIPEAGHLPYYENPAAFDEAVCAFLRSVRAGGAVAPARPGAESPSMSNANEAGRRYVS